MDIQHVFLKTQGTTSIGDGSVAAIQKQAYTNEISLETLTETTEGFLQTEVAFSVTDEEDDTKIILSKTINLNESQIESSGDTQDVSVKTGFLTGKLVSSNKITFSWDGTPCSKEDFEIPSDSTFPNNMHFRVCHKITVKEGVKLTIGPGAKIGLDEGGSIVIENGANVNVETGGKILIEGTITNDGTITNNGGTITIDPRDEII